MLIKAKKKSIYTELHNMEIIKFLIQTNFKFDLLVAGDVLIYVGKLDKLFHHCNMVTATNGHFIFSIENLNKGDFKVSDSGRFAHGKNYVIKTAMKHGWQVEHEKDIDIRKENCSWVKGTLFSLLKK